MGYVTASCWLAVSRRSTNVSRNLRSNRRRQLGLAPERSPARTFITMLSVAVMMLAEEGKMGSGLRVFVQGGGCSGFQYGLMIEEAGGSGDKVYESNGVRLFVDPVSISYLKGAEVDFVDTVTGGGFTIKNPNASSTCGYRLRASAARHSTDA